MNGVRDLDVTFEQPSETLDDIDAVRRQTSAPISIDESLVSYANGVHIARNGSGEIFNIKSNRVGGLTRARRLRDIAIAHGIQMYIMPTGGTVLADAESAHLAQTGVAQMNAIDAARLGLGAVTHFYGIFEALYKDNDVQTVGMSIENMRTLLNLAYLPFLDGTIKYLNRLSDALFAMARFQNRQEGVPDILWDSRA